MRLFASTMRQIVMKFGARLYKIWDWRDNMKPIRSFTICIMALGILATALTAQNLTPQEIIDKHLAAVGTKEKRDSIKTLIASGTSEFEVKVPAIKGGGKAVMVSDPDNLFFVISLN